MAHKKKVSTGIELEYRVARIEFAEGAFARTQVPAILPGAADADVLTDIDVLSLEWDARLRETRTIFECKSTRGQSGEADRLLWLSGFQKLLRSERAILVRRTVTTRGRRVAAALDVTTFDAATLQRRETEHAWLPPRFAHLGGERCGWAEKRAATQFKALGEFSPRLGFALWHEALLAPPHRILGPLVTLRKTVERMAVLPDPAGQIVAYHALLNLVLAVVRAASRLDEVSSTELGQLLEIGMMTGDPNDKHVLRILAVADAFFRSQVETIHSEYVAAGAERLPVNLQSALDGVAVTPGWLPRVVDLAERYRGNAHVARTLPQTVELACFDALLGGDAWTAPAFDHLFTREHRQLLDVTLDAMQTIGGATICDRAAEVLQLSFDRSAPALPERRTPYSASGDPHSMKEPSSPRSEERLFAPD
ncbi:MAG TPA: hypothetical protein VHJ34_09750 [Actinomycetota bacterium]|nr:hypothetical protein [Actinomycetota bacterium]